MAFVSPVSGQPWPLAHCYIAGWVWQGLPGVRALVSLITWSVTWPGYVMCGTHGNMARFCVLYVGGLGGDTQNIFGKEVRNSLECMNTCIHIQYTCSIKSVLLILITNLLVWQFQSYFVIYGLKSDKMTHIIIYSYTIISTGGNSTREPFCP